MLTEGFQSAAEDMQARALREEQVEALRLIDAVTNSTTVDQHLLSQEELSKIQEQLGQLQQLHTNSTSVDDIRRGIEALSAATEDFAARRMNANIRLALTGKNLSEIE
jgi:molecular chaperone HscA